VCDLDGVLYLDGHPIPGSGAALREIAERGYRIVFATNNSTRTPAAVAARIEESTSFPAAPRQVVTSSMAAASLLHPEDSPVLVIGEAGVTEAVAAAGLALTDDPGAAAAVVVGYTRRFDYDMLVRASAAVRGGARFVATNTDATLPTPTGPIPGGGSLVAAVATAAGRTPEVGGKPHRAMAEAIERLLGPGPTWVVGDRPETDLALAAGRGWTGVLVLTGVTGDPRSVPSEHAPDLVLPSLADLPALLG